MMTAWFTPTEPILRAPERKKPHPLDDPNTPQWQRELWEQAEPKGRR